LRRRRVGTRDVGPIGFGEAGLSVLDPPTVEQSELVIQAAYDAGVTLFDTATCYVPSHDEQGYGERLIAGALRKHGVDLDEVVIASKAGIERVSTVDFATDFVADGSPATIRRHCEATLRALETERIDLYLLHSPDPKVPLTETMGAFGELRDEGKIDLVGMCNVSVEQLDEVRAVVEIDCVQNKFSPAYPEGVDVIARCAELGVAFLAYSPLGGLGDRAKALPGDMPVLAEIAAERGVSPHRIALAWELALAPVVIPLVGARRVETISDSAQAADIDLSADELTRLAV
jgi:aryl-alcohol dehydrogenase-like predicted oxidoreductase